MANITILYDIAGDKGTLTADDAEGWSPTLPVSNLRTDDPLAVARYIHIDSAPARLVVAMDRPRPISCWAIIGHNSSPAGTMQIGVSDQADLSDPIYVSPAQTLRPPNIVWGSLPWGAWPADGYDPDAQVGLSIAYHLSVAPYVAQYTWVEISDPDVDDGYWQAGRLLIGEGWQPPEIDNMDYGASIHPVDPSTARRTRGGRRVVFDQPRYRTWELRFSYQSKSVALGVFHDLQYRLGKKGEMLIIWDADEAEPAIAQRLTLYCALAETAPVIIDDNDAWSVVLTVEELT